MKKINICLVMFFFAFFPLQSADTLLSETDDKLFDSLKGIIVLPYDYKKIHAIYLRTEIFDVPIGFLINIFFSSQGFQCPPMESQDTAGSLNANMAKGSVLSHFPQYHSYIGSAQTPTLLYSSTLTRCTPDSAVTFLQNWKFTKGESLEIVTWVSPDDIKKQVLRNDSSVGIPEQAEAVFCQYSLKNRHDREESFLLMFSRSPFILPTQAEIQEVVDVENLYLWAALKELSIDSEDITASTTQYCWSDKEHNYVLELANPFPDTWWMALATEKNKQQ